MPNKSFSIYNSEGTSIPEIDDRLVIEVGKTHLACIVKNKNNKILAFELFNFTENKAADFSKLFTAIAANSKLISKSYEAADIFINNELSILVPKAKFDQQIAADYIAVMFGEDTVSKLHFDHLPEETGIVNIYRVEDQLENVLNQHFSNITIKHSWSSLIKTIVSDIAASSSENMYIQFYNTFIVVTAVKERKLQIIQSFIYEAPEDVLYTLLNIAERFKFNKENLILQISGMIDLDFTLYKELTAYFTNVEVLDADIANVMPEIKEFPLHYFTPFFNLAL